MLRRFTLLGLFLTAAGCGGGGNGSVTGTVTLDGKPFPGAAVSVLAATGDVKAAYSEPDGRYTVGDLPPGPCKVSVTFVEGDQQARDEDIKKGITAAKAKTGVPERYTDPDRSGFAVSVAAGQVAKLDIDMKSK